MLGPGKPGSYLIIKLILIIYLGGGASALIALSNVSANEKKHQMIISYINHLKIRKKIMFVCLLGPGKPGSYLILIKKKLNYL